jgi:hypothetical protein
MEMTGRSVPGTALSETAFGRLTVFETNCLLRVIFVASYDLVVFVLGDGVGDAAEARLSDDVKAGLNWLMVMTRPGLWA